MFPKDMLKDKRVYITIAGLLILTTYYFAFVMPGFCLIKMKKGLVSKGKKKIADVIPMLQQEKKITQEYKTYKDYFGKVSFDELNKMIQEIAAKNNITITSVENLPEEKKEYTKISKIEIRYEGQWTDIVKMVHAIENYDAPFYVWGVRVENKSEDVSVLEGEFVVSLITNI